MRGRLTWTLSTLLLVSACEVGGGSASTQEAIVEGRLLAPCCYVQTLDVHESPMATELRDEVRSRLAKGESPDAIEDDFAARFGERVRAVPKGREPRRGMFDFAVAVLIAGAVGLGLAVRRWRNAEVAAVPVTPQPRDADDDRVDEELRAMDG